MSVVLSEHLPLLASAPDGIQKLRGLILELAVRGKLVPQDPDDEPASELLKRIMLERARLEAQGGGKKSKPLFPVAENEQPFDGPDIWEFVRLGSVLEMVNGRAFKPGDWRPAGIPIVRIQNLNNPTAPYNYCDAETLDGRHRLVSGDFLISWSGTPGTSFGAFIWNRGEAALNQHIFRCVQIGAGFTSEFLRLAINSQLNVLIAKAQGGVGLQHVTKGTLEALVLPLPPLAEQHRIVKTVDELMALCDRLEAEQADVASAHTRLVETLLGTLTQSTDAADLATNWQRLAEHFDTLFVTEACVDTLKQTILELAVTGRLLAQNEADRPVSETLNELELAGGNAKVRRGVIAVADSLRYTPPQSLPCNWSAESIARLLQLGAIVDVKDGNHGANHPKVSEFSATGLPFITAAQVSENGTIDYDGAYKVSGAPLEKLRVGFARPGDVIYTHKGSVGRVAICDLDCVLTPQTTYYRLNPSVIHNHFFAYFLRSPSFRNQVDVVKRQTTRDFVSISAQYEFFCHIPPLDEQIRIVQKVDELMALCDRLKADLATARHRQATLADTLIESALDAA